MAWKPLYASLAEARTYLRITDVADTADDTNITLSLTAASRAIDNACSRQFGNTTAAARVYTPFRTVGADRVILVSIDDLMTVTSLVVTTGAGDGVWGTTVASTDYTLMPLNAAANGMPWTVMRLDNATIVRDSVRITGVWGWTAVPDTIKSATLLQASRFYKRRDAPFGIAGSPEQGSEMRLLAKLDADVAVMVGPYRRYW